MDDRLPGTSRAFPCQRAPQLLISLRVTLCGASSNVDWLACLQGSQAVLLACPFEQVAVQQFYPAEPCLQNFLPRFQRSCHGHQIRYRSCMLPSFCVKSVRAALEIHSRPVQECHVLSTQGSYAVYQVNKSFGAGDWERLRGTCK
ncbi:hypothetical protein Vretimale_14126 [Volvox reticuliferus]|uniref:Uncharacterized protein n=1 Tax=Volvox reticuliferus TaxID=1737510 RepID=A0A8J4FTF9_9CHLO|nr:hypothetical protein Vretifemale_16189 [Volvox reticuliferus]GIM10390.1 hypothetical protein Vretimale_14126 [Volvox reticuliferus]